MKKITLKDLVLGVDNGNISTNDEVCFSGQVFNKYVSKNPYGKYRFIYGILRDKNYAVDCYLLSENCKNENHYINLASKIKIKKEITIIGLVNKINDDKSFTVSITDVILDN